MSANEILNSPLNKTQKILKLADLGWTEAQIAQAIGSGRGFVWAVLNVRHPQNNRTATPSVFQIDYTFIRRFGVEIELYGIDKNDLISQLQRVNINCTSENYNHNTRNHWKIVSDSSISGDRGFELVSPVLEGEQGLEDLKKVSDILVQLRAKINKTCGMHIHFDASRMSLETIKNVVKNYIAYEPIINEFLPESRRNNTYCQTLLFGSNANTTQKINNCTTIRQLQSLYDSRYYKVNLQAYSRHNTIEFRQHSGTIEFEKIEKWVRFLDGMVKFSEQKVTTQTSFESLNQFCNTQTMNYLHLRRMNFAA